MNFSIQKPLENTQFKLIPLQEEDFESVYEVASNPKVWEQHPNKDRYQKEVFKNFFQGAMESKGAFKIIDKETNEVLGSTRFYGYNEEDNSISIGYTFYGTNSWGKGINQQIKTLMLNYIFQFVDKVHFHVGKVNIRSQKAMEKLGGIKTDEVVMAYYGEEDAVNIIYEIKKENWIQ